ncbi:MAG TPA: tetratricopeptide repeat protein [Methylomusa anaerophila]|uniref:Lipoprotein NlpI n=1 Tax=Methylomusa anaerophila TaxID=1930071 RepID=A0A348AKQ5_9FIRM|nr:tetratricopeptide repeat protein [Methylomusa anaerophila]BBB91653.1 lipoprotein NlpI [Methylomusa anaerophila]HML88613.1 tetratricopeptide repeat protein [Methylomusa anaerophila]
MQRQNKEIESLFEQAAGNHRKGHRQQAEQQYRALLAVEPDHVNALNNLGAIYKDQQRYGEAEDCFQRAVAIDSRSAPAYYNLGTIYQMRHEFAGAIKHLAIAHELAPDKFMVVFALANACWENDDSDKAEMYYRRALALEPRRADVHNNLGVVLIKKNNYPAAVACFQTAISLQPQYADAYRNLSGVYYKMGLYEQALECCGKALAINPELEETRFFQGCILLVQGQLEEGFKLYESRFFGEKKNAGDWDVRYFGSIPRWRGEFFSGKKLLVRSEQGFGDCLQFARYLPQVKARGGYVALAAAGELLRLFHSLEGVDELVLHAEEDLRSRRFDLEVPLMSLPLIFGTTLNTIPAAVPYLRVDGNLIEAWRRKITGDLPRVGLVWAGSAENKLAIQRTCGLQAMAKLAAVKGVSYYSLQKGEAAGELQNPPAGLQVADLTADIGDFADTGALIENLDLVISIDTSVVHLAGALGKPAWVLLPHDHEWRWLLNRDDSPWYPGMRIFRQKAAGDWNDVMGLAALELRKWVKGRIKAG